MFYCIDLIYRELFCKRSYFHSRRSFDFLLNRSDFSAIEDIECKHLAHICQKRICDNFMEDILNQNFPQKVWKNGKQKDYPVKCYKRFGETYNSNPRFKIHIFQKNGMLEKG